MKRPFPLPRQDTITRVNIAVAVRWLIDGGQEPSGERVARYLQPTYCEQRHIARAERLLRKMS